MSIMSLFSLEGKKAVVTGASRGIGRAVALGLAEAGADVAIIYRSYTEGAKELGNEIEATGRKVMLVQADVTKNDQVEKMVGSVLKQFGRIDVLVNNAGINLKKTAEDFDDATWNKVLDINLNAVFHCSRAVGKIMIKQKAGCIINVTSLASKLILRGDHQCAYHVSKAGVVMLTRALADEWAQYNVRVNAIGPGYTKTQLCPTGPDDKGTIPISRLADPREMAGTVIWLASEASSYVTGQEVFVDGGWSICGSAAGGVPPVEGYNA
jgi:NAD(P)-dependent dehydrogenase (short-subunit alcohol dehydrogenase family)